MKEFSLAAKKPKVTNPIEQEVPAKLFTVVVEQVFAEVRDGNKDKTPSITAKRKTLFL
jgi:hypothetical protein